MTEQEVFVHLLAPHARKAQRITGIPASVSLAQAALESGWGKSLLAKKAKNLFGIKAGRRWRGKTVSLPTTEYVDGHPYRTMAIWRMYDSYEEAFIDHAKLFYNGLYDEALPYRSDAVEFAKRMAPVYATDPTYATKLLMLMRKYDLGEYDLHPKDWELDADIVPEPWYGLWAKAYRPDLVEA